MLADVAKVLMTTLNVDDVGLVQNRSRVYQGAGRSAEGQFSSNAPVETVDIMAEEAPGADSIAVRPESQISIKTGASPNQQEIERRREIVRHFFNDFWISAEDKPGTFAERLNRAEGHINERLAARGETWQLDAASRKQLGLPPPKTRLD